MDNNTDRGVRTLQT